MHSPSKKTGSSDLGVLLFIVAVLACAGLLGYLIHLSSPDQDTREGERAYYMGREFIQQTLKAPSTATFSPSAGGWRKIRHGLYHVWGEVDAQNTFGVPLRNEWECAVTQLANGKWMCLWRRLGDDQSSDRPKYLD